ncbi:MAG TPA: hypothetical protein VEB42_14395 [Chitinophagaceae bacterium]|nr:hypothetical protein [Chitinophagaceae bacterium]
MERTPLKVHIAADNALVVNGLRHSLERRYGSVIRVTCSYDLKNCLRNLGFGQDVVVVDDRIDGINGEDLHRKILSVDNSVALTTHVSDEQVAGFIYTILYNEPMSVIRKFTHKLEDQLC